MPKGKMGIPECHKRNFVSYALLTSYPLLTESPQIYFKFTFAPGTKEHKKCIISRKGRNGYCKISIRDHLINH